MKKPDLVRQARQEIKAALRLGPLVLVALLVVALFWRTDSAAISGLFQSSPAETAPVASATPTSAATSTVVATVQPTAPFPTQTAPPTQTDVVAPTPTPPATSTPTPSAEPSTATPVPSPTGGASTASPTPDEEQRYADESSNLKFEWPMLFDSVALFLSYAWLCCGGLVFLAVPLIFIVLWVASKRRQPQEE